MSKKAKVGTARCAVRAAFSGATRGGIRTPLAFRSARWTLAGTSQRDIPTALNTYSL
ncbi:MAG: hypothetical protein ABI651_16335 [Verrucomicrobiota bacterium]